jgi:hypothetical protein
VFFEIAILPVFLMTSFELIGKVSLYFTVVRRVC